MSKKTTARIFGVLTLIVIAGWIVIAPYKKAEQPKQTTTKLQQAGIELGNEIQATTDLRNEKSELIGNLMKAQQSGLVSLEMLEYFDSLSGSNIPDYVKQDLWKLVELNKQINARKATILELNKTLNPDLLGKK